MKIIGVLMTYNCGDFVQNAINQIPKNEFDEIICTMMALQTILLT